MAAPLCRLCKRRHWTSESHVYPRVYGSPAVTYNVAPTAATPRVTRKTKAVTPIVTEDELVTAAVTHAHECPVCGLLHSRPKTGAERVREHRARKAKA